MIRQPFLPIFLAIAASGCDSETYTAVSPPLLVINTDTLDFGDVPVETEVQRKITLVNQGQLSLDIYGVTIAQSPVAFSSTFQSAYSIARGNQKELELLFKPMEIQSYTATLTISNNAQNRPDAKVLLIGNGLSRTVCGDCANPPQPMCLSDTASLRFEHIGFCANGECEYLRRVVYCVTSCDPATGLCRGESTDAGVSTDAGEPFELQVGITGTGQGQVTSSPAGINCPGDCEASFNNGTQVTLTSSVTAGSSFSGWSGAASGTASEITLLMDGPKTIAATFDATGILLTPTTGLVTSETGDNATFTAELLTAPTAEVVLSLSSSNPLEGTVRPILLAFTSTSWDQPQTVTILGQDDSLADGNQSYRIITHPAISVDASYNGLDPSDLLVTNLDDDLAGFFTQPSNLITSESGTSVELFVRLTSAPTADVTLAVSSSEPSEGTVSPSSLTFTSLTWNVEQPITITGVDDTLADGNQIFDVLLGAAVSSDQSYNGLDPADVQITNVDDDTAAITVSPTSGLVTSESGVAASFTILLGAEPTADVTVGLSTSDATEGSVNPTAILFTSLNWNTAQPVTVMGANDDAVDGDQTYTVITAPAVSTDPNYGGVDAADVDVTNMDDDVAGITVSPTSLQTTESGGTATFTLVLDTEPAADVTIPLASSNVLEGRSNVASIVFTTADWFTPKSVLVSGEDDDIVDGDQPYSIATQPANSSDPVYDAFNAVDVAVVNQDDDVAAIVVTPTSGLTTTEGGTGATFSVVLGSEPTSDVGIDLSVPDASEGTLGSPLTLTFTPADWDTPQQVTVTGVDDDIDDDNQPYTCVTAAAISSDPSYSGMDPDDVTLTNTDDDTAGITVTSTAGLRTSEDATSATFTIVLDTEPTSNVTITLSSGDTSEGSVAPAGISFSPGNWYTPRTITVTGVDDADYDCDQPFVVVTGIASSGDINYLGMNPDDVAITNEDNESETFSNHWYEAITCGTWLQCEAQAVSQGGHLVSITSVPEQQWLVATFGGIEWFWIGLTDVDNEGFWGWSSGESLPYTNWLSGEPNDLFCGEDYGAMNWVMPGEWNDLGPCSPEWTQFTRAIVEGACPP